MKRHGLVSVIMPVYNGMPLIKASIQSLLNQSYENWECIIVNDGSPDDTKKIAKKWCELDERFIYIEQETLLMIFATA